MQLQVVSVTDFGAVGDGVTDDTYAIQKAMDAVTSQGDSVTEQGGGTLFFPPGSYVVKGSLTVGGCNLTLQGVGSRNSQVPAWLARSGNTTTASAVPSTLYMRECTSGFVLPDSNFCNGFHVSGLTLVGPLTPPMPPLAAPTLTPPGPYPQSAFLFNLTPTGNFNRNFVFEDVTVSGFPVAFLLAGVSTAVGSQGQSGLIRVVRCSIQNNQAIALTGTDAKPLQWNAFIYHENDSGENAGGIDIAGLNVSICDNVLESTYNAVSVNGQVSLESVVIRNNYFEGNTGDYCISLNGCPGPWVVGPNNFLPPDPCVIPPTQNVVVTNSARGVCYDPAWLQYCINVQTPDPGTISFGEATCNNTTPPVTSIQPTNSWLGLNNPAVATSTALVRVDTQVSACTRPPTSAAVVQPVYTSQGKNFVPSPFDGAPIRVTSGNTAQNPTVSFDGITLAIPANDSSFLWVVGCVTLRRNSSSVDALPAFTVLAPNCSGQAAFTSNFQQYETYVRAGDWAVVTFAFQLANPATSSSSSVLTGCVQVQPYGPPPSSTTSPPPPMPTLLYDVCSPILYVVADINDVRPYFNPYQAAQ